MNQMIKHLPRNEPRRALVLFTSDPGKEALRKKIGKTPGENRAIYQAFLRHLLHVALSARQTVPFDFVITSDATDERNIRQAFAVFPDAPGYMFLPHSGKCFAAKFPQALETTLKEGYDQAVIIGNDCLDLTPETLTAAFQSLDERDISLGPAKDGGFYLLGLKQFDAQLFENIQWCSDSVLAQVNANIRRLKKSVALLPLLKDIDNYRDLHRWLCTSQSGLNALLANTLRAYVALTFMTTIYLTPFLTKQHFRKRRWQMPPPGSTVNR